MTDRRTAILVAVAVVAGATVAGVLLATQGSGKPARVLQIDEVNGRVGSIGLGDTARQVLRALGKPGIAREGSLAYRHPRLDVPLRAGRVTYVMTEDPAARTEGAVRIGDPLSAARASYRKAAKCNPNSPDKQVKRPFCVVTVPAGRMILNGDPIRTIELLGTG